MGNQKTERKRLGALDIMIIVIVIVCLCSVAIRYFTQRSAGYGSEVGQPLESYIISFEVKDLRNSSAVNCMNAGDVFFIEDENQSIGKLREDLSIQVAEKVYESADGQLVTVRTTGEGDLYRVDVRGSFESIGRMTDDGSFLLGGNLPLAVNKEIKLYSKFLAIEVRLTDISRAD